MKTFKLVLIYFLTHLYPVAPHGRDFLLLSTTLPRIEGGVLHLRVTPTPK
ncbi:hypothetical protein [Metallosphaera hakonensis]|nr:hypothetical protein [Metallosphaera hakonensis]